MDHVRTETHKQLPALQVLRAFAFLGIFTSHCHLSSLGVWGVSVFFVLSGFLMVYSYWDREIKGGLLNSLRFAADKVGKLYFLHILTMIADLMIPVLFLGSTLVQAVQSDLDNIVLNVFLVQSWSPESAHYFSMNAVSWYLSDCLFLYAVFPLFLRLLRKLSRIRDAVLLMAAIYTVQLLVGYGAKFAYPPEIGQAGFIKWVTYIYPAYRLGDFCVGGVLGYIFLQYKDKTKTTPSTHNPWLATPVELLALLVLWLTITVNTGGLGGWNRDWFRFSCLFTPSSLLLVWVFARGRGVITRLLSGKVLLFIGNISANAFLLHQVVIHYVQRLYPMIFNAAISNWTTAILSLGITAALSVGFVNARREALQRIYIDSRQEGREE